MARGGKNRGKRKPARRSLENPSVPINVAVWNEDAATVLGAAPTGSGVRVTEKRALGYPAVWRAASLISGDIAKLSLVVYQTAGEGRAADPQHPAYWLCRHKANDHLLAFHFRRVVQLHALLRGNGYAYIHRDGGGKPLGMYLLDSNSVEPFRRNGRVYYEYEPEPGAKTEILPAADVFHIHGLGDDGLQGYPALQILRESIGSALAARDYGARNFKNSARPGGVIEHPAKLSPQAIDNMRNSWERLHKGPENAHKIAIMQEGAKFTPVGGSAREAQLLENREFDSREVANIFGVPAHKLGDPSKVAYNSLGEENQSYFDDTLSHWMGQWSAEASDKLLAEGEKRAESHVIDFDYRQVKRANLASLTAYATAACGKWASVDETRDLFGDNPLPAGMGKWQKPAAPEPAPAPPPEPPADPPARSLAGLRAVVMDTARRMAKRITSHAARLGAKWSPDLAAEHDPVVREAFAPMLLAVGDAGLASSPDFGGWESNFRAAVAAAVAEVGPDRVGMAEGEIIDRLAAGLADRIFGATQ
jgi:HK97 family phage portal protein